MQAFGSRLLSRLFNQSRNDDLFGRQKNGQRLFKRHPLDASTIRFWQAAS
jgi:hypothetical protein